MQSSKEQRASHHIRRPSGILFGAADRDRTGIISLEDRSSHFANQVLETTFQVKAAFAQR
jgi:hypothetical protein